MGRDMATNRLSEYRRKRDLSRSGEPSGGQGTASGTGFVVQRHDASSLHFDVRFEIDGVLASWAVPKGPSMDPREKRLAVRTEDHPVEYAAFEGDIPEGYGAGSVVVWDVGTFTNATTDDDGNAVDPADGLRRGHLKLDVHGRRLRGLFALTRTRMRGDDKNWILVKVDDGTDRRADVASASPESVLSGLTNEDVSQMADRSTDDVDIPNPDKVMYPDDGVTKADVVDYYRAVAKAMLPHLRGRPLALRRYPDGIGEQGFVQQSATKMPDWVRVETVRRAHGGGEVTHVICDDLPTLVFLAGQAGLELHAWTSTIDRVDRPDRLVIDLDPSEGVSVGALRDAARSTRKLLQQIGATAFVQTTGSRGYHVVAPLDTSAGFDDVRALTHDIARVLEQRDPESLTTAQRIADRGRRVYLDVGRNAYGQTAVCPYSLRARPGAPAATPIDWSELGKAEPAGYGLSSLPRRLAQKQDPWRDIALHSASPGELRSRLDELMQERH